MSRTAIEGLISAYIGDFEAAIGGSISAIGVDMCLVTRCDNGCSTVHHADHDAYVVSANETTLVGVNATASDDCVCPIASTASRCSSGYCYNNGICHNMNEESGGVVCECPPRFSGVRCQGTARTFDGGNAFAWFRTLPACTSLNVSFSFATK